MKIFLTIIFFITAAYAVTIIVSLLVSKQKKIKPFISKLPEFTVVGHRGAPARYPGNTMESFKEAVKINSGVMLELDIHQTKDGYIVVNHDSDLENSTGIKGHISHFALEELQKIDAGHNISFDGGKTFPFRGRGFRIPLFEEVLHSFKNTLISIDIKHHTLECTETAVKIIRENGASENVILGSFSDMIMNHIRKNHSDIATSFSQSEVKRFFVLHKLFLSGYFRAKDDVMMIPEFTDTEKPEYLDPGVKQGIRIITRRFIKEAHGMNIPVMVWTVNKRDNMERLYSWGVRGIITDYPDMLTNVVSGALNKK